LIDFEKNKKTLHVGSGGKYRIKTSKKKVRYNTIIILGLFFSKARLIFSKMINPELLIVLTVPIRLRKRLIKQFKRFLRKKYINVTFKVNSQKTFNGCRPAKKVRKKRRKFRLFKKI